MALSQNHSTPSMEFTSLTYPVKASAVIFTGALVVTSDGYAKPGLTATGLRVLGVAQKAVTGGASDGDTSVVVDGPIGKNSGRRLFRFRNDATTPLTQADVGASAYIKDDNTFSGDSTGRTAGGKLRKLETVSSVSYVWIELAL